MSFSECVILKSRGIFVKSAANIARDSDDVTRTFALRLVLYVIDVHYCS